MLSRLTALSLLLLAPATSPAPSTATGGGGCPDAGSCHLTRWSPTGLQAFHRAGRAVALDGSTAVVGAPGDDAVHVYERDGGHWAEVQRLDAPAGPGVDFGAAVGLHGDRLVVGAPESPGAGTMRGAVHVFDRAGGVWSHTTTFLGTTDFGFLGAAVAASSDWVLGGAPGAGGGEVRVYREMGPFWAWIDTIEPLGTGELGSSLALAGDDLLIGDWADNDLGANAGAVYQYWLDTSGPLFVQKITASDGGAGDFFGFSLGFDGSAAVVGAYGDDDLGPNAGAAYVFERELALAFGPLVEEDKLGGCATGTGDNLGRGVAVHDGTVVVGSPNQENALVPGGRAFVYRKQTWPFSGWALTDVLSASDGLLDDTMGAAVAVSGEQVLLGAPGYSQPGALAGAAYLFSLQTALEGIEQCPCDGIAVWESYGEGKPGTLGVPELALADAPLVGESNLVGLSSVAAGTTPILAWGTVPAAIPFDAGLLLVGDPHFVAMPTVTALQQVGLGWNVPLNPGYCGVELFFQALLLDPAAAGSFHTAQSNGVRAILGF